MYNGAVEAAATLLGALTVVAVGFASGLKWERLGDWAIVVVAVAGGAVLILMGVINHIWMAYVGTRRISAGLKSTAGFKGKRLFASAFSGACTV